MRESIKSGLKFLIPTLICISSIHLLKQNGFSWYWHNGHYVMTEQAIGVMSNDIFLKYRTELKDGSIEPDKNRIISHLNVQECAYTINSLAKECETMIKNNENWSKIMFTMGQTTHYIQDLNCPHHSIGYYMKGDHEQFEEKLLILHWKKENYDGFYHIKNYKLFAINTSNFSKRYLRFTYKLEPYSYEDFYEKLITPLWDHSVHCTAHLWLTIIRNGLGEEKYKELGFPEPVGTRDDQKIKFYKIKELK